MSELRRRIFAGFSTPDTDSTPTSSREHSPAPEHKFKDGEEYKVVAKEKLEKLKTAKPRGTKRRIAWVFALGGLFGIFVAGFFASNNGSLDDIIAMAGIKDMNLDTLLDVLPSGLIKDVQDIQVSHSE